MKPAKIVEVLACPYCRAPLLQALRVDDRCYWLPLSQQTTPALLTVLEWGDVRSTRPRIRDLYFDSQVKTAQGHIFKAKTFRRPRPCDLCRQPIQDEGSSCRVCKYACHKDCESKVIATCDTTPSYDLQRSESLKQTSQPGRSRSPTSQSLERSTSSHLRDRLASFAMDITYVTERIIVLAYPDNGDETTYRSNLKEVTAMLRTKHGNKYMVFNLSERRRDLAKLNIQVLEYGWPPHTAPPLEKLCSICKALDNWMMADPQHVAVLHSKGDKGRTGVVIAAHMHYTNICASADQALDRFSMKRFYNNKLADFVSPSQKRYINYFAGLLSGAITMNNNPLYLHNVVIHGIPNFDGKGGCKPFVKIYQGLQPVFTSGVYNVTDRARRFIITLEPSLQLRGDVLLKCYHKRQRPLGRSVIFSVQFHTCTLDKDRLIFLKEELDEASNDPRFPNEGKVEFLFSYTPEEYKANGSVHDATLPTEQSTDPIVKWDSYENFDMAYDIPNGVPHTEGPIDGSLYATIAKKRSPVDVHSPYVNESLSDVDGTMHTVSMDSGISSSSGLHGLQIPPQPAITNGKVIDVEVHNAPYPKPSSLYRDEHAELDELINGMLREIQNIPDHPAGTWSYSTYYKTPEPPYTQKVTKLRFADSYSPPVGVISVNGTKHTVPQTSTYPPRLGPAWRSDHDDHERPYHSRSGVAPFSYGVPSSSPPVPRRRVQIDSIGSPTRLDGIDTKFYGEDSSSLVWLERQQEKLKARKQGHAWDDRQQREQQLMAELRSATTRKDGSPDGILGTDLSSSSRETSPVKSWVAPPQQPHVSFMKPPISRGTSAPPSPVIPSRSSSKDVTRSRYQQWQAHNRPLARQKSDISHDRPFFMGKRSYDIAHEPVSSVSSSLYPYTTPSLAPLRIDTASKHEDRSMKPDTLLSILTDRSGLLPDLSPMSSPVSPGPRIEDLQQSLHAISRSPTHSPPLSPTFRQPPSITDGPPSWSSSLLSTSPPASPTFTRKGERPVTPSFPVAPRTPYANQGYLSDSPLPADLPSRSPTLSRKERTPSPITISALRQNLNHTPVQTIPYSTTGQSSPTIYAGQSQRSSMLSLTEPVEVISQHPKFVKDISKYWYKPNISREEAIILLKDKPPGTFLVRDSNSFPGAFGLALKVASPPPNIQTKPGDLSNELVRHFLIEPTSQGVRLKGCPNEPIFGSLSALVYQHSITPLALPCKLLLPEADFPTEGLSEESATSAEALLAQGAACNVLYLLTVDTESLTGPQAVRRAVNEIMKTRPLPFHTVVHFKVSSQGITLTDNNRKLFFRRHYPVVSISHCGMDPEDRRWTQTFEETGLPLSSRCFGFVARKPASKTDNQCHVFAELDPEQPASAIVNFVTKVMMMTPSQSRTKI